MAGKIIADIIEAPYDSIRMNVANVTVLTANSSGLTYVPTGNVNINIGNTANITVGTLTANGIKFPATQVPSADANTLDDYEEGTWTPTVVGNSTAGTYTLSSVRAYYTKVGNQVTLYAGFGFSAASGGSGYAQIGGLPFAYKSSSSCVGAIITNFFNFTSSPPAGVTIQNTTSASSTTLYIGESVDNGAIVDAPVSGVSTSTQFYFTLTYTVS
jgi:hypothetical protein